jgi:cysteine desulfurase family protein
MQVYLDNTATSWPKPKSVVDAIAHYLTNCGASPGRSGHSKSLEAARILFDCREMLADFFGLSSSDKMIFTPNATYATNTVFQGFLEKGDHVIISQMEHNSTHRPLRFLEKKGIIDLSIIHCDSFGSIDLEMLQNAIRSNTKLISSIHGSNVNGSIMPIEEIGQIARAKKIAFHIDAAQTAGYLPIDMKRQQIDILTFTGHKKMYGPSGIGGLCVGEGIDIATLIHGGSGSKSELDTHPDFYPDKLEAGTPNTVGIAGLKAGLEFILKEGQDNIRAYSQQIKTYFLEKLAEIPEIKMHTAKNPQQQLPVISISVDNSPPDKIAMQLDREFGVMTRPGLHCAPLAHKSLKTLPQGTLRFSPGYFQTKEEMDYAIAALKKIILTNKK